MKKLSISLLVMLLIASLFTSCSMGSDDASDVRVKVKITPSGGGRSLTTDIETINLDDDSITWHYSATKVSETQFNYGATSDSILPKDGIVTLSQGDWTIGLRGEKDGKEVYAGTTNNVTIKWNFYEPNVTVQVPVKQSTVDNGFIVLNNVKIPNGTSNVSPNYILIDKTEIKNFPEPYLRLECAPGSHKITFEYRDSTNAVISSKSLFVTVLSGRETTISGNIEEGEITSGGSSAPTSEVQVIEVKKEAEVKVETSVVPATTSTTGIKTTVTFPAGSFNADSVNAVLNLSVKSADSKFSVSAAGQSNAVAGISVSLLVNDKEVTTFNDEEVEIETYIATDLTGVEVYYDGQPLNSSDYEYNSADGKLIIRTKHFSEFYVGTNCEAVNVTTNKGYATLKAAIDAVTSGDTVVLLKDVELDSSITIKEGKELTINLNGNDVSCSDRPFIIYNAKVNFVGEGTIYETVDDNHGAIHVAGSSTDIANYTVVSIGKDVTLRGWSGIFIAKDDNGGYNNYGIVINLEGKAINPGKNTHTAAGYGVYINGSNTNSIGNVPVININGAHIESLGSGIYAAGYAKWNIKGDASISGKETAIEIRAGELTIDGGTFTATANTFTCDPNGDGTTTSGAAIAVAQHTTKKNITVEINGGTFTGIRALNESNPQANDPAPQVSLAVKGGTFNGVVSAVDASGFIIGGTFSSDPSDYVALGYNAELDSGKYVVSSTSDIIIKSANQLMQFAASVNSGNDYAGETITLNRDIDLNNEEWTPIGQKAGNKFAGVFDGNNKTISGLFITENNIAVTDTAFDKYVGLFGAIAGGTVKNLTISGSVTGKNAAGIVARMESGTIENCESNVTVVGTNAGKAGGIVCLTNTGNCTIKNCINNGNVSGVTIGGVGGIAAYVNDNTTISNCTNNAKIGSDTDKYSGGIAGYVTTANGNYKNISIENCTNKKSVTAYQEAGGIVGIITEVANITDCSNSGAINAGQNGNGGGIAGSTYQSSITDCRNTASVYGKYAGGVIGVDAASIITNCSGGTADITSPVHVIGFTGHSFTLSVAENKSSGRILGAHQGAGPDKYTVLVLDDNNSDSNTIPTVGICGNTTTMPILKISSGTFYGDPLAGNGSTIILESGAKWGKRAAGTYTRGGVTESSRIAEWTISNN